MKSITAELNRLRAMTVAQLAEKYVEVFGRKPHVKHKEHLQRKIAWQIQAQRFGGLSETAQSRLDALIGELDVPFNNANKDATTAALRRLRRASEPAVGTVLVRKWRDQEIHVHVRDNGYEHDGVLYKSLTAVAKAVTGAHWNGRLFFNLTKRKRLNLEKIRGATK